MRPGQDDHDESFSLAPVYTGPRTDVVVLSADEAENGLPAVCLCCGAPATVRQETSFPVNEIRHHAGTGIGALIALGFIVGDLIRAANGPRLWLRAPFCEQHRDHWQTRKRLIWGGVASFVAVLLLLIPVVVAATSMGMPYHGLAVVFGAVGFLGVVVVWALVLRRTIHKIGIGSDHLMLGGVHEGFLDALEAQRERRGRPLSVEGGTGRRLPPPVPPADRDEGRESGSVPHRKARPWLVSACGQLTAGVPLRTIKDDLLRQGADAAAAEEAVAAVLAEMPAELRSRYGSGRLFGPLIIAGGLLAFLAIGLSELWILGLLVALLICPIGAVWAWAGFRKTALAEHLEQSRHASIPVARLAAPAPAGDGLTTAPAPARPVPAQPRIASVQALAAGAVHECETKRTLWMSYLAFAPFSVCVGLLVCSGILLGPGATVGRPGDRADADRPPGQPAEADANAPDPNEGPAPKGWTVLFRADDPALWNTDSPGKEFAVPVRRAHSTIRYLRLKRLDTGESLIVAVARARLADVPKPLPERGHAWQGTAKDEYKGRHLGIFHGPRWKWPDLPKDGISVLNEGWDGFAGSGFGHKVNVGDRQYCCWKDKEIPKTAFGIAVTADPLTEDERRRLVE